jgi:hypothetical protein
VSQPYYYLGHTRSRPRRRSEQPADGGLFAHAPQAWLEKKRRQKARHDRHSSPEQRWQREKARVARSRGFTRPPHETTQVKVWVEVDVGIAGFVRHLNTLPGVRTYSCCQGTIGEGGAEPYPAYVSVSWLHERARRSLESYGLTVEGVAHGIVRPPEMQPSTNFIAADGTPGLK